MGKAIISGFSIFFALVVFLAVPDVIEQKASRSVNAKPLDDRYKIQLDRACIKAPNCSKLNKGYKYIVSN